MNPNETAVSLAHTIATKIAPRAGSMQPPSGDTALEMVGRATTAQFEDSE